MQSNSAPVRIDALRVAFALLVIAAFVGIGLQPTAATHQPADKAAVSGSGIEILGTPVVDGLSSEEVELMSATMKTSGGTDLFLSLTMECALWTDVTVVGNDESEAVASVKAWIEIDGEPLAVASDDTENPGEVVFCNRAFKTALTNVDDEDMQIDQYLRTRSANAFNWIALDLEPGVHTLTVKARLDAEVTGAGMAMAGIGKRTFIAEPTKLANDVVL